MLLCDNEPTGILITACFIDSPQPMEHWFCRRANHPPVGPFVFLASVTTMANPRDIRDQVASVAVRTVNRLSRLAGRGSGTVVGGRVGMKIAPDLVASLARGRTVILVSGTNGKTTTTSMIVAGWGGDVTTNETGANMPAGHAAALVESKSERVALEVDEGWLADSLDSTRPRVVVLLNLSRDQMDRANEVRHLAERWRKALESHDDNELVVVANANDPLVVYAAESRANTVWADVPTSWLADALSCPKCTLAISHVGSAWHCSCGFAKPAKVTTTLGDEFDHRRRDRRVRAFDAR